MSSPPAAKRSKTARRGLEERLAAGETVLCAEGYLLAFTRSGYVAGGLWVSDFILDHPEVLRRQHYEFVHSGSDVTEAYQYYTHRRRMGMVGKVDETEKINRLAIKIAKEVAEDTGTLLAGGISNTDLFVLEPEDSPAEKIRGIFEEQVRWAKEGGVDYVIAETISEFQEAKIALEVIKSFDLPAVVTLAIFGASQKDGVYLTRDKVPLPEACRRLLELGATLVGVNCSMGPSTMIEAVRQICKEVPPEKVCALPVTFRTTQEEPSWMVLTDKTVPENNPVYPDGLDAFYVSQVEIAQFTSQCLELGLRYFGICCGNTGSYTRVMAQAMGKHWKNKKYRNEEALTKAREMSTLKRALDSTSDL